MAEYPERLRIHSSGLFGRGLAVTRDIADAGLEYVRAEVVQAELEALRRSTLAIEEARHRLSRHISLVEQSEEMVSMQGEDVDQMDLAIADLGSALRSLLAALAAATAPRAKP